MNAEYLIREAAAVAVALLVGLTAFHVLGGGDLGHWGAIVSATVTYHRIDSEAAA